MITRVIFQDIDGPLIPFRLYFGGDRPFANGSFIYDPIAVGMLKALCEQCEAKIVFNTAHNENPAEALRYQAQVNGFAECLHPEVKTGFMTETTSRLGAVDKFRERHPEIKSYCIIDDYKLNDPNAIQVDFNVGMTMDTFQDAKTRLTGKRPPIIMSVMGTSR